MSRSPGDGPWSTYSGRKSGKFKGSSSGTKEKKKPESFKEALKEPITLGLKKSSQVFVMFLQESDRRFILTPGSIAQRYFEAGMEFPLIGGKTRGYYEAILKETNSVRFIHLNRSNNPRNSDISFSKAFICGVMSIEEWGLNPNKCQRLLNYHGEELFYNYWDYIEAWRKAFYYQNQYNTHTWFFRFEALKEPSISINNLPHWFFQWFILFGPESNYFPDQLKTVFELYSANHPRHQSHEVNPVLNKLLLRFLGHYHIPWIWQWNFNTTIQNNGLFTLTRDHYYKWWKNFDISSILIEANKDIDTFISFNDQVKIDEQAEKANIIEKTEFKTPSIASLKERFPNTPTKDLKKKILEALAYKLEMDVDEDEKDDMSISSTPISQPIQSDNEEGYTECLNENEDMATHMGQWLSSLYKEMSKKKDSEDLPTPPEDKKGKGSM